MLFAFQPICFLLELFLFTEPSDRRDIIIEISFCKWILLSIPRSLTLNQIPGLSGSVGKLDKFEIFIINQS